MMRRESKNMLSWFKRLNMHRAFRIGMLLKGAFALSEIASGVAFYFVSLPVLSTLAKALTRHELMEDPHDFVANHIRSGVEHLTGASQHFAAWYLFGHGIVKLWLIAGLLRKRLWYYPVAMIVFGLFVVYQVYRITLAYSVWLILLSTIDIVVIGLTWYEYEFIKSLKKTRRQ